MMTMTANKGTTVRGPFAPSSQEVNNTSASQSDRPVTIPHIPELYQPLDQVLNALFPNASPSKPAIPAPVESQQVHASHPFMNALKEAENRTTTENSAAAYKSTLSPTLDAFASLSQGTDPVDIARLLDESWRADPLVTLRVIWNLRSIHEGKSARETFYRTFAWLYQKHPKTAIANLRYLVEPCVKRTINRKVGTAEAEDDMEVVTMEEVTGDEMEVEPDKPEVTIGMPHGYWKDLLNILLLAATNQLTPASPFDPLHDQRIKRKRNTHSKHTKGASTMKNADGEVKSDEAKEVRFQKHKHWNGVVVRKLQNDRPFRALYISVARLFADALARDIGILRRIADDNTATDQTVALSFELSLVGKWAPSIGGSHDRITNIATPIAELLYVEGHLPLPASLLEQPLSSDVAHKLRSAYTRWAISPLRRFLQVPEIAMSTRQWSKIKYTRVPSKCMQMNKNHFYKHDAERFSQYLKDVAQGKKKISGATLLPNELLHEAMKFAAQNTSKSQADAKVAEMQVQVIEAQWISMVERVRESGALDNALALCDVSGSMGNLTARGNPINPIFPAVALSIVLSQVSRAPWANNFITFSATPEIVSLDPNVGLVATAQTMARSGWGMNTDFNAVFTKLILPVAKKNKLKPEDMVKRLFVFSDMQFDNSRSTNHRLNHRSDWKTEHQIIKEIFNEAGYEVPELVYWNLAGNVAKPITKGEEGVAFLSGFSPGLLKNFLEGATDVEDDETLLDTQTVEDGEFEDVIKADKKRLDPVNTMLKALGRESFAGLVVLD